MTRSWHIAAASALAVSLLGAFFPVYALLFVVWIAGFVWFLCVALVWMWLVLTLWAMGGAAWEWWKGRKGERAV